MYMCACVRVVSRCVYVCLLCVVSRCVHVSSCMCGVYVCAHVSVLIWCGVRGCIWSQ